MPYHAKPREYIEYDHKRRAQRGTEFDLLRGIKNDQFIRATLNREWLATKSDRLRLMGGKK